MTTDTDSDIDDTDADHRSTPRWTTGEKYGVGTARNSDVPSRVWFTLTEGAITDPRFPRVDLMNLRSLDFLVTDGDGYVQRTLVEDRRRTDSLERRVEPTADDALAFGHRFAETDPDHEWTLAVETITDSESDAVVLDVAFDASDAYDIYVVAEPAPSSRARYTRGERHADGDPYALSAVDVDGGSPVVRDEDGEPYHVALALEAAEGFDWASADAADGDSVTELLTTGTEGDASTESEGVVTLVGRLGAAVDALETTVAVGFATGRDVEGARTQARDALDRGFSTARAAYVESWRSYLAELDVPESVASDDDLLAQYRFAAMVLEAVEDETYRGAGIASPSVPWGDGVDAGPAADYGYNFVWSRDLYQVATAMAAAGDVESAIDATEYLFTVQLERDGFLPQNTYLEGRPRWDGEQLDNVAYPVVLAYHLSSEHGYGLEAASYDYEDVRRIAEYLVRNGPATEQERWEEEAGYSPSTIAAEIAALTCAAWFADRHGERTDAVRYLAVAEAFADGVERWCATERGIGDHDETPYYVRVSADGDPDRPSERTLANGGPTLDERAIVDAGFLELVRLGIKPWDDEIVRNSLVEVDETIRVETPHGPAWYRYNGDGYGEQTIGDPDGPGAPWSLTHAGRGRLWPIFTGERGEYELRANESAADLEPTVLLEAMAGFANSGLMLPEQVWDREKPTVYGWEFGQGTGSATPLAWSCAQYVRLAHSIDAGEPVETPAVVEERFLESDRTTSPDLAVVVPELPGSSTSLPLRGETTAEYVVVLTDAGTFQTTTVDETFALEVDLEVGRNDVIVVAVDPDGTVLDALTAVEGRTVTVAEDR